MLVRLLPNVCRVTPPNRRPPVPPPSPQRKPWKGMADDAAAAAAIAGDPSRMLRGVLPGEDSAVAEQLVADVQTTLDRWGGVCGWWWGSWRCSDHALHLVPASAARPDSSAAGWLLTAAPRRCPPPARLARAIEVKDISRTSIRVSNALEQVAELELLQVGTFGETGLAFALPAPALARAGCVQGVLPRAASSGNCLSEH